MGKNKRVFSGFVILTVVFTFLTFTSLLSEAAEESQKMKVSGVLDFGYYTQYVGSLSGSTIHNQSVFQQSASFYLSPLGLYFSVWDSYSPKGSPNSDFGDEIDFTFGIKRCVKTRIGEFTFNGGYAYYDIYNLKDTKTDAHGLFLVTEFPKVLGLTPSLWIEEDFAVHGGEKGFYYRLGLNRTQKILPIELPLNVNLSVAGHDAAFGKRAETVSSARLSISVPLKLKRLTITPVANFQKRLGHYPRDGGVTEDRIWGGINFSLPLF